LKVYFIDSQMNRIYLKNKVQKTIIDSTKIGIYYKSQGDLFVPGSIHNDNSLDGLITYETAEMHRF